jgi:hypothetical protein
LKNVNLAKVRSAIAATIALAAGLTAALWPAAGAAQEPRGERPRVVIALLPGDTSVDDLGGVDSLSPGILSAGIGEVVPDQTYLDITQGNRIFDSLYDDPLTLRLPRGGRVPGWSGIVARAGSAPADIVPGLLAGTLAEAGVRSPRGASVEASPEITIPALLAADPAGRIGRLPPGCAPLTTCAAPVAVANARVGELPGLIRRLGGDDLLIALQRPPPGEREGLALGIAGRDFEGNLTSDSTRLDGYVLSTDLAPTILQRLAVAVPSEMSGEPIRAEGEPDAAGVAGLGDRLSEIGGRRGAVIGVGVLAWLGLLLVAVAASRGRLAAPGLRLFALAVVYLPLALLAGALLKPGVGGERLLVLLGAPLLGAATLALAPGWRALAGACAATTLAYAVDVVAGSPLTSLSLIGPNPALGVRFYGIGNELEAALAPLVIVGTGAAIAGFRPGVDPARGAAVFLGVGLLAAFVFAAGRFGADVGAAIVFPVGAAAAAAVLSPRRLGILAVIAVPIGALALLAVVDLLSGGGAHLTGSVLDAGGLGELADVAERRLTLSARSFGRAISSPFLPIVIVVLAAAVWQRRRLVGLWSAHPALRASFLGAAAATLVGTLANDSGALLLEVGTAFLLVMTGYVWAESRPR